jgi:hypothetical protein
MKPWSQSLLHRLILLVIAGAFVAAHGTIFYVSSHATVSIAAAVVILLVIKHLGLVGPLFAWFQRRRPPRAP